MTQEFDQYVKDLLTEIKKEFKITNISKYLKDKEEFGVSRIEYKNITIMYTTNKRYAGTGSGVYLIISNAEISNISVFGSRKEFKIDKFVI